MKTSKPISTISFNTEPYLRLKLDDMVDSGLLSFWAFIRHEPEPDGDEAGGKVHFHVYAQPSKLIQTDELRKQLIEPVKDSVKPLGCLMWCNSKWSDWYLYGLHDKAYLLAHGETRKLTYTDAQVVASDSADLQYLVRTIDRLDSSPYRKMRDAIAAGVSWESYFARGGVPVQQIRAYKEAWTLLESNRACTNVSKYISPSGLKWLKSKYKGYDHDSLCDRHDAYADLLRCAGNRRGEAYDEGPSSSYWADVMCGVVVHQRTARVG